MRAGPVFSSEAGVQRCPGAMVWEESQKVHRWGAGRSLRSLGALGMGTCLGGLGAGREEPGSRGRDRRGNAGDPWRTDSGSRCISPPSAHWLWTEPAGNVWELEASPGQEGRCREQGTWCFSAPRGICGEAALGQAPRPFPSKGPTQTNETGLSRDSLSAPVLTGGHPVSTPPQHMTFVSVETSWFVTPEGRGGRLQALRGQRAEMLPNERARPLGPLSGAGVLCWESQAGTGDP